MVAISRVYNKNTKGFYYELLVRSRCEITDQHVISLINGSLPSWAVYVGAIISEIRHGFLKKIIDEGMHPVHFFRD